MSSPVTVVTGAFGYSGQFIARRLLDRGDRVLTLTSRWREGSPFGDRVTAEPFRFDDPARLAESLRGARTLINNYWVRFDHRHWTHRRAVENTKRLVDAAVAARVERIVHVSITNPDPDSTLPYFRGKAELERHVRESGLSHAILRPTVLFGGDDLLVNNIAFLLRKLPVFGLPGRGRYRIRPVHVDDLAALAVEQSVLRENVVLDAVGPETFTFAEMVRTIRDAIRVRTPVLPMPPALVWLTGRIAGAILGDVVLTRDEIRGLSADLLVTEGPTTGRTRFSGWLGSHAGDLGRRYASELERRRRIDS